MRQAKIVERHIADGDPSVDYTVKGPMCRLARRDARDPRVIALARSLSSGKSTELQKVRAAFDYVTATIPYRHDPDGIEYVMAPIYTLGIQKPYASYRKGGDCDDQVTALACLLGAMGIDYSIRVLAWRVNDFTHVNLRAHLADGRTIPLDPTLKGGGWNYEKAARFREKVYRCPMLVRSLEDGPTPAMGGCTCGGGRNCRCGGGRRGCCPKNAASAKSPVNVIVNTGTVTSSRSGYVDASGRWTNEQSDSRSASIPINAPAEKPGGYVVAGQATRLPLVPSPSVDNFTTIPETAVVEPPKVITSERPLYKEFV